MTKVELPENFAAEMRELLKGEYEAYLESFTEECVTGLRVNTGKLSPEEFQKLAPFLLSRVPWTENGFYTDAREHVSLHPYYYAGLYYVQEPSAMLPAALLDVQPGERVLDLCAAPGGKATELGSRLRGAGLLVANDVSHSRAKALLKNLELHGIGNVLVCSESPQKLLEKYPEYFDKILVDAPCSGEGMFRRDPAMQKTYRERGSQNYVALQMEIAVAAVRMLKPGGRMVYSTCTFSPGENENILRAIQAEFSQMRLLPVPRCEGFAALSDMPECVRLYPHRVRGEGHFAALLQKAAPDDGCAAKKWQSGNCVKKNVPPAAWQEFAAAHLKKDFSGLSITALGDRLYALTDDMRVESGIRYLRTGLYLGDCGRHGFEPSQALAMYLRMDDAASAVSLSAQDERVIRYLKGETVELSDKESAGLGSWTLFCVDGYPLGWAKWINGSLRNKYYAGWRMH